MSLTTILYENETNQLYILINLMRNRYNEHDLESVVIAQSILISMVASHGYETLMSTQMSDSPDISAIDNIEFKKYKDNPRWNNSGSLNDLKVCHQLGYIVDKLRSESIRYAGTEILMYIACTYAITSYIDLLKLTDTIHINNLLKKINEYYSELSYDYIAKEVLENLQFNEILNKIFIDLKVNTETINNLRTNDDHKYIMMITIGEYHRSGKNGVLREYTLFNNRPNLELIANHYVNFLLSR
jgi:hypothetical protein